MINAIIEKMSLEEQVSLLSGADYWTTSAIERLNIPKIKVTDGPNGARGAGSLANGVKAACFPVEICVGASWNTELVRQMGEALAEETQSKGAKVLLAPTVNIQRSGLSGRNFECYSEDPCLTAELAVAFIQGLQNRGIAATIKHFVANDSEVERYTISSEVDERTLREIYLLPFEAAVKCAGVMAVMTAYNKINGTYACDHQWLLKKVLREEWGFDGMVMTDWFGSATTVESVEAGADLEMPGPTRDRGEKLIQAVQDGKISADTVKNAARRVLQLIERVGAFASPHMQEETAIIRPEHNALIRKMGAEGAVLLKNDKILPLAKKDLKKIAVIGPNANDARIMGGGSSQINAHYCITPLDGLQSLLGKDAVVYAQGCNNNRLVKTIESQFFVEFFPNKNCTGDPVLSQTVSNSNFFWFDLPSDKLERDNFSVKISTKLTVEHTDNYLLGLVNAGLAELYINDTLIIDGIKNWTKGENIFGYGNEERRAKIQLEAGLAYTLTVKYRAHTPKEDINNNILGVNFGLERPLGEKTIQIAEEAARNADVALVFAGRNAEWDMETHDLPDMKLPGNQDILIERIAAVNPKTIVVLQTGGPVEMPWLDKVAGVLQIWYPGQELGNIVTDILFGVQEPSGRLPQTFPVRMRDNASFTDDPITYPGENGRVVYREGIYMGYRHAERSRIKPLFPFGFGLGYTTFQWHRARLSSPVMHSDDIIVEIDILNTGNRPGSEVVQVYVGQCHPKTDRPVKELRAFTKLYLNPGESKSAILKIKPRDLAYFSVEKKAFIADAGEYEIFIAANAEDVREHVSITLERRWIEN